MDTLRVDIRYRPLRIAWAIRTGDFAGFRQAVRTSCALWGGQFNPIVFVDREQESKQLVDLFRVDLLAAPDGASVGQEIASRFPHLPTPFFPEHLFIRNGSGRTRSHLLDLENSLVHIHDRSEWTRISERGVNLYSWEADDPIADILLMLLGEYPDPAELGLDYRAMLAGLDGVEEVTLAPNVRIPAGTLEHPSVVYFSRVGLTRDRGMLGAWDTPGFFVGDSASLEDLVCFWNVRAAGIALVFVDPRHLDRFAEMIPSWEKRTRDLVAHRHEAFRHVAVWSREEKSDEALAPFGEREFVRRPVASATWNGLNVRPPVVNFARASTLGVVGRDRTRPRVSFQLNDKPFSSEPWFHSQHLVASISFGGFQGEDQYTLQPPYIPELNEFYARTMDVAHNAFRIESERIGLVIAATDADASVSGLPVSDVVEQVFGVAGLPARVSSGGLILRQLMAQLGGPQGARVFKIPGVRRLIRTHGPTAAFPKRSALQLIGSKDPENLDASFSDFEGLFIEPRPLNTKLTAHAVFSYLVDKGLFRIGVNLACPRCRMTSWIPLDVLKHRAVCDLCGHDYDASRQIVDAEWQYRRSGILGAQRDAQGAIPVALTLQQLDTMLRGGLRRGVYSPSLDLVLGRDAARTCEIDLVWVIPRPVPDKTAVILGECKDLGGIVDSNDFDHLREVADAFPTHRFATFVLLAKLGPFTRDEIARAKALNQSGEPRTILLTARELEPYNMFERAAPATTRDSSTPEGLARATSELYLGLA